MKKITVSILTTLLMLSMVFSSSVFAANEETSAWDSFLGLFSAKASADDVGVEYRGHVQNKGDFPTDGSWIQGPEQLGTVGESLRLEAFWIKLTDAPEGLHIKYEVHVQNIGWMDAVEDGKLAGTQGDSLRIEAIKIALVDDEGVASKDYSVSYKGHVQNVGDTAWFKDGAQLGTTGSSLRLEALEVKIEKIAPDLTDYEAALAAVTEANYTKASWATYQDVVEANVMTEDNVQSEVDAATAIILDAQEDLVTVPVIAGMSATAQKTITVTGTELSKLSAAMFTVAGNTVTAVTPNADGTSAALTLGTNLAPETNVKVTATIDGTAKEYTVKYTIAATTVVIEDQTFDYIQDGQKVSVLVNGVATTVDYLKEQGYKVTFAAWDSYGTSATTGTVGTALFTLVDSGVIQTPFTADKDFTTQVTIAKDGIVATSAKANIKIRNLNNNISDISAVTLKNYASGATFVNSSKNLVVSESAQVTKVVVGYGDAAAELSGQVGYTVESDNSGVVSVNSSGIITANGLGTANLKITAGKATYNLPITVVGTARKATTVALKDGASSFTYVVKTGTDTRTVKVAIKDQYGDPFYVASPTATGVNFTIPTGITGLTLDASTPSPFAAGSLDFKGEASITLNNATKVGQTGNIVFRNNDNEVIGTAAIVTSGDNVVTNKKLVVVEGPTDYVIDTELASKAKIKVEVHEYNASGVDLGAVPNLTGYQITCDPKVINITSGSDTITSSTTGFTIGTTSNNYFEITGLKAGSTAMLVSTPAPDNASVESKTVVVTKGTVKLSGANFLSPATVTSLKTINYQDVLAITEATGKDPILTGVTTTPSTVYNVRINVVTTSGISLGQIYLDKNADGLYTSTGTNADDILGRLDIKVTPSSDSTGWNTASNAVAGVATALGNKGNVTFNLIDIKSQPGKDVTVVSKAVAVNVPTNDGTSALTGLSLTGGTITPSFNATQKSYTATVANATATTTVTPTVNTGSTVTVNGAAATTPVALVEGANTINVVVTDIGKTPTTYTIVVTRNTAAQDTLQTAAESALAAYETKSAATVNFLTGSNAADSATAKTTAETAIAAYKTGGGGTMFDARKTAADGLNAAGQAIKSAYDAAVLANTAFATISPTTTANLETALKAVTSATDAYPTATTTVSAANTYVDSTKADAKTALNTAFDITVKNAGGSDGLLAITMPWVATPHATNLDIVVPTTGDYANKVKVVDATNDLVVQTAAVYTVGSAGTATVTVAPDADNATNTYFDVDKTVTVTVTMPIGNGTTPTANTPLTVSI